jgi:hypothetical protein
MTEVENGLCVRANLQSDDLPVAANRLPYSDSEDESEIKQMPVKVQNFRFPR